MLWAGKRLEESRWTVGKEREPGSCDNVGYNYVVPIIQPCIINQRTQVQDSINWISNSIYNIFLCMKLDCHFNLPPYSYQTLILSWQGDSWKKPWHWFEQFVLCKRFSIAVNSVKYILHKPNIAAKNLHIGFRIFMMLTLQRK